MKRFEYMKVKLEIIPQEVINQYELTRIDHEGWICIEIRKGIYGLPQAGRLANDRLKAHLTTYGYYPTEFTPGLWIHKSKSVYFTLAVDDFSSNTQIQRIHCIYWEH